MWQVLSLLSGVTSGSVFALAFWPQRDGSHLEHLAGWFVERQIGRLDMARRRHLDLAGVDVHRVVVWQGQILVLALGVLGAGALAFGAGLAGIVVAVVVAALAGWSVPLWATLGPYRRWQREIEAGLPKLVAFLPIYLETGYTTRQALERSVAQCPDPLRKEMGQALGTVQRTGSPTAAFENLAARVSVRELDQVLNRLVTLWNQRIGGDVLADMAGQFEALREIGVGRTVGLVKIGLAGAAFAMAVAILVVGMGMFWSYIVTNAGSVLGGL